MYLLDTNVISGLRRPQRNPELYRWSQSLKLNKSYLSILTIYEVKKGILKHRDDEKFSSALQTWLDNIYLKYRHNLIEIDDQIAEISAQFASLRTVSEIDTFIAASAYHHNLTLVTRNVKDFDHIKGLKLLNPWDA